MDEKVTNKETGKKFTAASMLAYEAKSDSDIEKVKWLYELGAEASEIVKGYAMAGNSPAIAYYLQKESEFLSALHEKCVQGYIFANKHELVKDLYNKDPDLCINIANEYALANNPDKAFEYYSLLPDEKLEPGEESAKEMGLRDSFLLLAKSGFNFEENSGFKEIYHKNPEQFYSSIVNGYAMGGKIDSLVNYLDDLKNNKKVGNFSELCKEAFFHLALCGHNNEIDKLYKNKEYVNKDTNAAIVNGYLASTKYKSAAKGFDVDKILTDYLENRKKDPRQYKYEWLPKFFQKSLSDKETAVDLLKRALKGEAVDLSAQLHVLQNGDLGRELRAFVKNGRADYLEVNGKPLVGADGEKIRTVTDFVNALDAVVNPKLDESSVPY
jgi:hypothetical protein